MVGTLQIESSRITSGSQGPLLSSYTAGHLVRPHIAHHQLRHLVVCPLRRGVVYIVNYYVILKLNLLASHEAFTPVANISFLPTCIAAISVPDILPNAILLAAGGIGSELYLGFHVCDDDDASKPLWELETMDGFTNDNSVVFMPPGLLNAKPTIRLFECRNDNTICVYSINHHTNVEASLRLRQCGSVHLATAPNYVSLSPDGKVLVCVGDTDEAYLFSLTVDDDDEVIFTHMKTYTLPLPTPAFFDAVTASLPPDFQSQACFSASWSSDGNRFAIASQEGQLTAWDFRTSEIIFNNWSFNSTLGADGILSVKFCKPPNGREMLLWTEDKQYIHAIDADTFDLATHCIIHFPDIYYLHGFDRSSLLDEFAGPAIPVDNILDIAGMCVDPTQEWLYVASVEGIAEFHVNG